MKNKYIMLLASFLVLALTLSLTSAILCMGSNGYYTDCGYNTYAPRHSGVSVSVSTPRIGVSVNTGYYSNYASNYNLGSYIGYLANSYSNSYAYSRNSIYVGRPYYSSYSYSPYSSYSYSSPYSSPYSSYSYGYNKYAHNPFSGSSGPATSYGASYGSVYVGSRGYANPFGYGW